MSDIEKLLLRFRADPVDQGRLAETAVAYGRDVRRFAAWFTGQRGSAWTLADITPEDGRAYRAALQ